MIENSSTLAASVPNSRRVGGAGLPLRSRTSRNSSTSPGLVVDPDDHAGVAGEQVGRTEDDARALRRLVETDRPRALETEVIERALAGLGPLRDAEVDADARRELVALQERLRVDELAELDDDQRVARRGLQLRRLGDDQRRTRSAAVEVDDAARDVERAAEALRDRRALQRADRVQACPSPRESSAYSSADPRSRRRPRCRRPRCRARRARCSSARRRCRPAPCRSAVFSWKVQRLTVAGSTSWLKEKTRGWFTAMSEMLHPLGPQPRLHDVTQRPWPPSQFAAPTLPVEAVPPPQDASMSAAAAKKRNKSERPFMETSPRMIRDGARVNADSQGLKDQGRKAGLTRDGDPAHLLDSPIFVPREAAPEAGSGEVYPRGAGVAKRELSPFSPQPWGPPQDRRPSQARDSVRPFRSPHDRKLTDRHSQRAASHAFGGTKHAPEPQTASGNPEAARSTARPHRTAPAHAPPQRGTDLACPPPPPEHEPLIRPPGPALLRLAGPEMQRSPALPIFLFSAALILALGIWLDQALLPQLRLQNEQLADLNHRVERVQNELSLLHFSAEIQGEPLDRVLEHLEFWAQQRDDKRPSVIDEDIYEEKLERGRRALQFDSAPSVFDRVWLEFKLPEQPGEVRLPLRPARGAARHRSVSAPCRPTPRSSAIRVWTPAFATWQPERWSRSMRTSPDSVLQIASC